MATRRRSPPGSKQVRPWRQERSAATVQRIVQATKKLLSKRDFDSLSVDEIVQASHTSKGAFYFRFATKARLLRHLAAITYEDLLRSSNTFFQKEKSRNLQDLIGAFVDHVAGIYTRNRNLLRAFLNEARPGGDTVVVALARNGAAQSAQQLIDLLKSKRREINHPDPDLAAVIAAMVVGILLRHAFLYPEQRSSTAAVPRDVLVNEIKQVVVKYLTRR